MLQSSKTSPPEGSKFSPAACKLLRASWLAGKQFWEELDRDSDGRVSAEDVKAVLRKRKLPEGYASDFIKAARGNRWWANSIE